MAIFKEIEKRLENLFEGFFDGKFRSALQPAELARKLAAEMDRNRQVSIAHTYAPNNFSIRLAQVDFEHFEGFSQALVAELSEYLSAYAQKKDYRLAGTITISLIPDEELLSGECEIHGHIDETNPVSGGNTQVIPIDEVLRREEQQTSARLVNARDNENHAIAGTSCTIGRKRDNDIVLNGTSVSRHHARIEFDGRQYRLIDLDSTNGTFVNGEEIGQISLNDGDQITFGEIHFIFRFNE